MNIHYLQHVPFEGLAGIHQWIATKDAQVSATQFYTGDLLPDLEPIDLLIVMGGPMNIYEDDKYPWLKSEKQSIEQAIAKGKLVLGICLGAQLVADVLGAKIYPNEYKEIGWFPVHFSEAAQASPIFSGLPQDLTVFHWHGDTFNLPHGVTHIATSEGCANQAFTYGENVMALQFHMEATAASLQEMIQHGADEIRAEDRYIQSATAMVSEVGHTPESNRAMFHVLDKFTALVR